MLQKRYTSEFVSVDGTRYRLDILQYADGPAPWTVEQVDLWADSSVVIEWPRIEKHDCVMSSSATINLRSHTDRKFIDLYHVRQGDVRLDVYRNDSIYWSGCMDTELYEEPYAYLDDYSVKLTFTDLASLDRKPFKGKGLMTVSAIIYTMIREAGLNVSGVEKYISTTRNEADVLTADWLQCDNFYDDNGEPMTMRKVLEGILRPYGLLIVQKAGSWHLFDWNAMSGMSPAPVVWSSTDAALSVDRTYSKVVITFSANQTKELVSPAIKADGRSVSDVVVRCGYGRRRTEGTTMVWTDPEGFEMSLREPGNDDVEIAPTAKMFRITPIYSGSEASGVAWVFATYLSPYAPGNTGYQHLLENRPSKEFGGQIFMCRKTPYVLPDRNSMIRLTMDIMIDPRYNPFENAGDNNEKGTWKDFNDRANHNFVPFKLELKDSSGNVLYHVENKKLTDAAHQDDSGYSLAKPQWVAGAAQWGDAVLCYYDANNRKSSSGLGGWQTNKRGAGYYRDELPSIYTKTNDGEYIPMPPAAGFLSLEIGYGLLSWDYEAKVDDSVYGLIKYMLYKAPQLTLCDAYGNDMEFNDVEYFADINADAAEPLEMETIVGTLGDYAPFARAQILASGSTPARQYTRAGITAPLEQLLCGTLFSQYGSRHTVLSGECELVASFGTLSDNNTEGAFAVMSELQDLRMGTSNIVMTQVTPDEYSANEEI